MKDNQLRIAGRILPIMGLMLILSFIVFHKSWLAYCGAFCEFSTAGIQIFCECQKKQTAKQQINVKRGTVTAVIATVGCLIGVAVLIIVMFANSVSEVG